LASLHHSSRMFTSVLRPPPELEPHTLAKRVLPNKMLNFGEPRRVCSLQDATSRALCAAAPEAFS
jgi:hypothetical protein